MTMTTLDRAAAILEANSAVVEAFFLGLASGDYYDGTSYQLYLDLDDDSLLEHQEASDQSWLQRDDGSLVQISRISGYCDIPEDERYTEGCNLDDYGYGEYLDQLQIKIAEALEASEA